MPGRSNTHLSLAGHAVKCASNYQSSVNDGEEPFLINATKQAIWYVNCICVCKLEHQHNTFSASETVLVGERENINLPDVRPFLLTDIYFLELQAPQIPLSN